MEVVEVDLDKNLFDLENSLIMAQEKPSLYELKDEPDGVELLKQRLLEEKEKRAAIAVELSELRATREQICIFGKQAKQHELLLQ